ncbi:transporter substrate-binding domain-containing protein [Vibrio sp. Of7-15]|uniref:substrate-binding periplasmic protein n=1 Tax=Vibrio sp. Of7-15 TaxID=2724879 RepID=UPI001EF18D45|nr:transporter substrate-binding domain-containing protein [Vibrio sp. Of7-15]MCG7497998.1 transporter substrate-binding domain-containing protein [Vibrio sp. Of7-15]
MKGIGRLTLFLCGYLVLSSPVYAVDVDRALIVVGEEFPPFEFIENDKVVGIDIDIASHIFDKIGIPVEFHILPWKRAWYMVKTGQADAVLSTSRKDSREPYLWYPEQSMWASEFVFFTHKKQVLPAFEGYSTILEKNLKVGIIQGNSYHSNFWQAFPYQDGSTYFQGDSSLIPLHSQLYASSSLKMNMKLLSVQGRIDVYPADKTVGLYTIKQMNLQDSITYYDSVLFSKSYPMPFSKASKYPGIKYIADKFDRELKILKESGEYQKIINKWIK